MDYPIRLSRNLGRSQAAFDHACSLIPGGVNSPARAFGGVGGKPLFIDRAEGAYLFDIDGNRYVDYIGSWGPMILGHRHPEVMEAILKALERGTSYGAPTERESQLAEQIREAFPSMQKVRLVSSGTEATMSAIRLARGVTGRSKIIKFSGNYHGHVDSLLVAAGSAAATLGTPDSPGVTLGTSQDTIVLEYNDVPNLERALQQYGHELAAIIVEPVVGNMGLVVPSTPFLQLLRAGTSHHGALLILDEVMTGFRVAWGGAQSRFGIQPDLTTLGKIVGGGLPLAAYGGRADLMDQVMPAGKVYQAGTLSGNPLATAAGSATLHILKHDPPYAYLEQLCQSLQVGLERLIAHYELTACVQRCGSMMTLFFGSGPIIDWPSANRCDRNRFSHFFWNLIDQGIYFPCSQFEALFVSRAHTPDDIQATLAAADQALAQISQRK